MSVRRIIVMQGWQHQLSHDILAGVIDHGRAMPSMNTEVMPIPWQQAPALQTEGPTWRVDGFIAPVISPQLHEVLAKLKWKCISTHIGVQWPGIPQVDVNHCATGVMAAEHLLNQGFEHFAYIGPKNFPAMAQRLDGFTTRLEQAGHTVHTLHFPRVLQVLEHRTLVNWIKKLPRPCAIYCNEDLTAFHLNSLCRETGLHVPDDIALLGTQDSHLICEGIQPALSSVHLPYRKIGYKAAEMLNNWIVKKKMPEKPAVFEPSHVSVRASTETLAIDDPQLKKAIRYIRENCTDNEVNIESAARHAGLSLRDMQRKFKQKLGHTPSTELQQARIRHIKILLRETSFPLEEIAWRCGYPSANYLCAQFRRITGMTPGEYRRTQ